MERHRGKRDESIVSYPIVSPETRAQNITRFIGAYLQEIRRPLVLMNHVAVHTFSSDEEELQERKKALYDYLNVPHDCIDHTVWEWGRTIVAEIVSLQDVQALLSHGLSQNNMYMTLVPTSIDASSKKGETPPKKGVDLCILQQVSNTDFPLLPICGIDVTTGKPDFVRTKLKKPPLQAAIAMPTLVLPLETLTYEGRKMRPFTQYLDQIIRQQIRETGSCSPFYGLSQEDATAWKI